VDPKYLGANKEKLTEREYQCAYHIVGEIQRVVFGARALRDGDFVQFGQFMFQSHESSRDFFKNSTPELDALVDAARELDGCYGARLTGGGFGGATDTQTASGTLTISGWQRGLLVVLNPVYSVAESISSRQAQARQVDARSFTLTLSASYQFARYASVFGGYTFFQQRTGGSSTTQQFDIDQNRIRFGLQFGYPINFD